MIKRAILYDFMPIFEQEVVEEVVGGVLGKEVRGGKEDREGEEELVLVEGDEYVEIGGERFPVYKKREKGGEREGEREGGEGEKEREEGLALVPQVTFYPMQTQLRALQTMFREYSCGAHLLLLAPQGTGIVIKYKYKSVHTLYRCVCIEMCTNTVKSFRDYSCGAHLLLLPPQGTGIPTPCGPKIINEFSNITIFYIIQKWISYIYILE